MLKQSPDARLRKLEGKPCRSLENAKPLAKRTSQFAGWKIEALQKLEVKPRASRWQITSLLNKELRDWQVGKLKPCGRKAVSYRRLWDRIQEFLCLSGKETQKLECFSEKQRIYNAFQKDCRTWYKTNAKTKTASEMRLKNAKNKNKHAKQKYKKNAKTKTASELRLKNAKTKTESEIATEKCEKQKQTRKTKVQEKRENKNSK